MLYMVLNVNFELKSWQKGENPFLSKGTKELSKQINLPSKKGLLLP